MCKVCGLIVGTSDSTTNFGCGIGLGIASPPIIGVQMQKVIGGQSEDSLSL